jgi:hypothetical protein
MILRFVSASDVVIWDTPRRAQPYSCVMVAMMLRSIFDVYHITSIQTVGCLLSLDSGRFSHSGKAVVGGGEMHVMLQGVRYKYLHGCNRVI